MWDKDRLDKLAGKKQEWEKTTLADSLKRFKKDKPSTRFYTPLDIKEFDFLDKVGFPGQYPYTAGTYADLPPGSGPVRGGGGSLAVGGLVRAGQYAGYGTAEDTRDFYKQMIVRGWRVGPNLAFDLPSQFAFDSDHPLARGEVGKVGVAVSSFADYETIFEPFQGDRNLDRIATNMTINGPANAFIAMYVALAQKRGIGLDKLRGTPQNDILKEYTGRGAYLFPPKQSLRLTRDSIVFIAKNMPNMNILNISSHMRGAGATAAQCTGYMMANGIEYLRAGVNAGLDIDEFASQITFNGMGGSMDVLREIAIHRASRRIWARILRERFGSKSPKSWLLRCTQGCLVGHEDMQAQRPLNNLVRATIGGFAAAMTGQVPSAWPPYDEPLRLGRSLESQQLAEDAARILYHESKLCQVRDPFAGSYFMESLTDEVEAEVWEWVDRIEGMGGAAAATESGYLQREVARSAYEHHKKIETGEEVVVGVNTFTGDQELEVLTTRLVADPYDPERRAIAEENQIAKLKRLRAERDNAAVKASLKNLDQALRDESQNTFPAFIQCAQAYATIGEVGDVMREVLGEYKEYAII